jgi:hypothetical protein
MAKDTNTAKVETPVETKTRDLTKYSMDKLRADHKTTSGIIRHLNAEGLTKGEIAKVTGKRYQHVRNVLITPVKNPTK